MFQLEQEKLARRKAAEAMRIQRREEKERQRQISQARK